VAEIKTITNLFFELLKSFCQKGNITNPERELLIRIAEEKFSWNTAQVNNLIDLELYPRFRNENISDQVEFTNSAIQLGIEQEEVAKMQDLLFENKKQSNYWLDQYDLLSIDDKNKVENKWQSTFHNNPSDLEKVYEEIFLLKAPISISSYLEKVANDPTLQAKLIDEGISTSLAKSITDFQSEVRNWIKYPNQISFSEILNPNLNEHIEDQQNKKLFKTIIDSWNAYNKLGENQHYIDQKWEFFFHGFTPQVQQQLIKLCLPESALDYAVFFEKYIQNQAYLKVINGLGTSKKQRILNALDSIAHMANKLSNPTDKVDFITTAMEITLEEHIDFLRSYYTKNNSFPLFWVFRYFIMKNYRGRDAELAINFISENALSNQELSQFYGVSVERIRQITENIPTIIDRVIEVIRSYKYFNIDIYLENVIPNCPTLNEFSEMVNKKEFVNFSSAFYRYFFYKYTPFKFCLLGDIKLLINHRDSIKSSTPHQFLQSYLIEDGHDAVTLNSIIEKLDEITSHQYGEVKLIADGFSSLSKPYQDVVLIEAANWRVKTVSNKGKMQLSYKETPFEINNDEVIIWKNRQPFYHQIYPEMLHDIFYKLEPETSYTFLELKEKYFSSPDNNWGINEFIPELINRFKKEAGIVSIANRWMSEAYARTLFDESLFELSKCSYRDAVVSMIKKQPNLNGKSRKEWVEILNSKLKTSYKEPDLHALSKDERLSINEEKIGRNKVQLFYLK
jgi:hypothetical protein